MDALKSAASAFRNVREQLAPIPTKSSFLTSGTLTPAEFIAAGELLVYKCPTWAWSRGNADKRRDYLPVDKQYLITKSVPCRERVAELTRGDDSERVVDDEWVETHSDFVKQVQDIPDTNDVPMEEQERPNDDEIPDMDEEDELAMEMPVQNNDPTVAESNIVKTRTYDIRYLPINVES
jgi:ubiquitin-like-conjugating enzyme ATG3